MEYRVCKIGCFGYQIVSSWESIQIYSVGAIKSVAM